MEAILRIGARTPNLAQAAVADRDVGNPVIENHVHERGSQQDQVGEERHLEVPEDRADHEANNHDEQPQPLGKVFLNVQVCGSAPGTGPQLPVLDQFTMERASGPALTASPPFSRFQRLNVVYHPAVWTKKGQLHENRTPDLIEKKEDHASHAATNGSF